LDAQKDVFHESMMTVKASNEFGGDWFSDELARASVGLGCRMSECGATPYCMAGQGSWFVWSLESTFIKLISKRRVSKERKIMKISN
jgi:hypothetical protein